MLFFPLITGYYLICTFSLQFVFLETCFHLKCTNQVLLLTYGSLVSAVILLIARIWLFMHLLKVYKNFGYGLADSGKLCIETPNLGAYQVSHLFCVGSLYRSGHRDYSSSNAVAQLSTIVGFVATIYLSNRIARVNTSPNLSTT